MCKTPESEKRNTLERDSLMKKKDVTSACSGLVATTAATTWVSRSCNEIVHRISGAEINFY